MLRLSMHRSPDFGALLSVTLRAMAPFSVLINCHSCSRRENRIQPNTIAAGAGAILRSFLSVPRSRAAVSPSPHATPPPKYCRVMKDGLHAELFVLTQHNLLLWRLRIFRRNLHFFVTRRRRKSSWLCTTSRQYRELCSCWP